MATLALAGVEKGSAIIVLAFSLFCQMRVDLWSPRRDSNIDSTTTLFFGFCFVFPFPFPPNECIVDLI